MATNGPWWRRAAFIVPVLLGGMAVLVVALAAFQPWRLFIDVTVDEALPTVAESSVGSTADAAPEQPAPDVPTESVEDAPEPEPSASPEASPQRVITAEGQFISHEHPTAGTARIITLADGSRVLRLVGLDTDNGPDLKVWLAAAPVIEGNDGWFVFDDDEYLDLGPLKGNKGNQNYSIPDDADISDLTSVTIWCDRFSVSFGAAELLPA
jgi:hypothetical protein